MTLLWLQRNCYQRPSRPRQQEPSRLSKGKASPGSQNPPRPHRPTELVSSRHDSRSSRVRQKKRFERRNGKTSASYLPGDDSWRGVRGERLRNDSPWQGHTHTHIHAHTHSISVPGPQPNYGLQQRPNCVCTKSKLVELVLKLDLVLWKDLDLDLGLDHDLDMDLDLDHDHDLVCPPTSRHVIGLFLHESCDHRPQQTCSRSSNPKTPAGIMSGLGFQSGSSYTL